MTDSFGEPVKVGDYVFKFSQKRCKICIFKVLSIHPNKHKSDISVKQRSDYHLKLELADGSRETSTTVTVGNESVLVGDKNYAKSLLIKQKLRS